MTCVVYDCSLQFIQILVSQHKLLSIALVCLNHRSMTPLQCIIYLIIGKTLLDILI